VGGAIFVVFADRTGDGQGRVADLHAAFSRQSGGGCQRWG
jgi:hypothetical protein